VRLLYCLAKTHASCAVVEQIFAGWSDGPVAHLASGPFAANAAWLIRFCSCHGPGRAAAVRDRVVRTAPGSGTLTRRPARPRHRPARLAAEER
jgi:hypothetical protein